MNQKDLMEADLSKGGLYWAGAWKWFNTLNNSWLAVHMNCAAQLPQVR